MSPDEILRVANGVLTLVCLVLMVARYPSLREQPAAVALLLYTLGVFVAVSGYASLEALLNHTSGPAVRVPLVTSALVLCAFGLVRFHPRRRDGE